MIHIYTSSVISQLQISIAACLPNSSPRISQQVPKTITWLILISLLCLPESGYNLCVCVLICHLSGKPECSLNSSLILFIPPLEIVTLLPSLRPSPPTNTLIRPSSSTWTVANHLTASGLLVPSLSLCCQNNPVFSTSDHAASCLKPLIVLQWLWFKAELWSKSHFDREGVVSSYCKGLSCGAAPVPAVHQPSLSLLQRCNFHLLLSISLQLCMCLRASLVPLPYLHICLRCFSCLLPDLIIALFVSPSDKQLVTTL